MAFFGKDITAADLAAGRLQGSEKEKSEFNHSIEAVKKLWDAASAIDPNLKN